MTHELIHIVEAYKKAEASGIKTVMATVVELEGSSYRRPGVRMLLLENGGTYGAVSGGCVEKEVFRQAAEVFETGTPKMMTYDGRYRLGCEGILYILIEPFNPEEKLLRDFEKQISARAPFELHTYYNTNTGSRKGMKTLFLLHGKTEHRTDAVHPDADLKLFRQTYKPRMRIVLFGGEHDAVVLSSLAASMGWEVLVVVAADEAQAADKFPAADVFLPVIPETADVSMVDEQTAVMLMTHSYVKDLKYLLRLSSTKPSYLGILGPANRRERLLNELLERMPEVPGEFFDKIYGPAGIDIGAEGPQEIGISILAEILAVFRSVQPVSLKEKSTAIHS